MKSVNFSHNILLHGMQSYDVKFCDVMANSHL